MCLCMRVHVCVCVKSGSLERVRSYPCFDKATRRGRLYVPFKLTFPLYFAPKAFLSRFIRFGWFLSPSLFLSLIFFFFLFSVFLLFFFLFSPAYKVSGQLHVFTTGGINFLFLCSFSWWNFRFAACVASRCVFVYFWFYYSCISTKKFPQYLPRFAKNTFFASKLCAKVNTISV